MPDNQTIIERLMAERDAAAAARDMATELANDARVLLDAAAFHLESEFDAELLASIESWKSRHRHTGE